MWWTVRPPEQFAAEHIPGSINIAFPGSSRPGRERFSGLASKPVLVAETDAQVEEANLRMSRVGIEDVRGYLAGGIGAWKEGRPSAGQHAADDRRGTGSEASRTEVCECSTFAAMASGKPGHIVDAQSHALDAFPQGLPSLEMACRLSSTARAAIAA